MIICLVVLCYGTSLVLDSFNKYGFYVAIAIGPETKHSGGLATGGLKGAASFWSLLSALVLLVSTKNRSKLCDYCYGM